jgi:ATP-dependent DNA ligase
MQLPFQPPLEPMLAKLSAAIPEGPYLYEPKWDGFRALVFRDGDTVQLQSRDTKPLERYFPELLGPLRAALPERAVVDGEIVIAGAKGLDFEALLQRIHPAKSRIDRLAAETPASFVVWDLLAIGDEDLRELPLTARRERMVAALKPAPPVHLTPVTLDRDVAVDWFERFEGAGLDGVVAKRLDGPYEAGKRAMLKIKHARTADCVVGGFRWHKSGEGMVGSLLLALYDDAGGLHHVGVTSSFTNVVRKALVDVLAPYRDGVEGHPWLAWSEARVPGNHSRWNAGKDLSFVPIRPELVCEVGYDHLEGSRFRHTAQFKRWRPDKPPKDCRYDQLEVTAPYELSRIFGGASGRS